MRAFVVAALVVMSAGVVVGADLAEVAAGLKSKDAKARQKAAEELGAAGKDARPFLRQLCDATIDPNQQVAAAALLAVGKVEPKLFRPLSDIVINPAAKGSKLVKGSPEAGASAIAELKDDGLPAAGVLLVGLKQSVGPKSNGPLAQPFAVALARIGADDPETVKVFGEMATSKAATRDSKRLATTYFEFLVEGKAERFAPIKGHLESLILDPDIATAKRAMEVAGRMRETAAPLLPTLEKMQLHTNPGLRAAAFETAAKVAPKK